MDFGMEVGIFLAYTAGLMLIYLFGRLFVVPVKVLLRLFISSLAGGILLVVINSIGGNFGLFIPVNIITAGIAGILGIPGILGLIAYFVIT